jgi:hypothetical protein
MAPIGPADPGGPGDTNSGGAADDTDGAAGDDGRGGAGYITGRKRSRSRGLDAVCLSAGEQRDFDIRTEMAPRILSGECDVIIVPLSVVQVGGVLAL